MSLILNYIREISLYFVITDLFIAFIVIIVYIYICNYDTDYLGVK